MERRYMELGGEVPSLTEESEMVEPPERKREDSHSEILDILRQIHGTDPLSLFFVMEDVSGQKRNVCLVGPEAQTFWQMKRAAPDRYADVHFFVLPHGSEKLTPVPETSGWTVAHSLHLRSLAARVPRHLRRM